MNPQEDESTHHQTYMPQAGSSLEPAAACSCLDWARSPHLHTAAGSRPDPAVSLALGFPAQVLPGPWVPWTHSYYRLRHVTITPTQLKTKLLGSETCKWYVFVVSVAGYSRLCQSWVRHAASGQASPGNGKRKTSGLWCHTPLQNVLALCFPASAVKLFTIASLTL